MPRGAARAPPLPRATHSGSRIPTPAGSWGGTPVGSVNAIPAHTRPHTPASVNEFDDLEVVEQLRPVIASPIKPRRQR